VSRRLSWRCLCSGAQFLVLPHFSRYLPRRAPCAVAHELHINRPMKKALRERLIGHVNRKWWWHVPPADPNAYKKRGKFLASSFAEAEFWGRPLDEPQKVKVSRPLIGDEATIERALFGRRVSDEDITVRERFALDARMKKAASAKGYDSIVLMSPASFAQFRISDVIPRSLELNILRCRLGEGFKPSLFPPGA
jgi:hypothetical protein